MWGKVLNKNGEPNPSIHKFIRGEKNNTWTKIQWNTSIGLAACRRLLSSKLNEWYWACVCVCLRSFIEFYSQYSLHSGAHGTTYTTIRRFTQTISVSCVNMCAVERSCYDPHISVAMVRLHVTCLPVSFVCGRVYWTTSTSSIVVVVERAQTICALNEMVSWMK